MAEAQIAIAIYNWATAAYQTGGPAVVSTGMFTQWLIFSYLVSCHKNLIATVRDKVLNDSFDFVIQFCKNNKKNGTVQIEKSINEVMAAVSSRFQLFVWSFIA